MNIPQHLAGAALTAVLLTMGNAALAATTRTVGPGQTYTTVAAAIAAAQDGDTINVMAGTYVNDFAEMHTKVTLAAIGGRVTMRATGLISNGKGILITDTDITINGFTFQGAKVSDDNGANGAGIRYQGGSLVLNDCYFVNNQNGLLASPVPTGTITINHTEFYHNGAASGPSSGYTHNLYVGAIAVLDIESSYFHGAYVGHEIKSRAAKTIINNTRVLDGPTGTASYSIDLPNGGVVTISANKIEQGPLTENPNIIAYGEEGGVPAGSSLKVTGNLIENDLKSGSAAGIWNASTVSATVLNNRVYGLTSAQLLHGPGTVSQTTYLTTEPAIGGAHAWNAK